MALIRSAACERKKYSKYAMKKPTMKLSRVVARYFDAWICQDSWDSFHPLDTARFYRFVKAVVRYSRRVASEAEVHALIVERWSEQVESQELDERAKEFAELYATLLAYEKTKGFPDPLIERTDIAQFYVALRGDKHYRNRRMTEVWGKDWHTKLYRR
jgi:hypothetical protein